MADVPTRLATMANQDDLSVLLTPNWQPLAGACVDRTSAAVITGMRHETDDSSFGTPRGVESPGMPGIWRVLPILAAHHLSAP